MNKDFPRVFPMGERAILVEFEPEISESNLQKILRYREMLQEKMIKEKVEVISAYSSLLVNYPSPIEDVYSEVVAVQRLLKTTNIAKNIKVLLYHLPVCYEQEFAPDLALLAEAKNLSEEEIIELHTASVYTVYFTGFLPGFLYLGGLDERLHFPRKDQPRLRVEKGAVGIGGNQTGIYPRSSPGGWQIIGNSPVPLFDKNRRPPCEISPGSKIRFYRVSKEEHDAIFRSVEDGRFSFKKESYEG